MPVGAGNAVQATGLSRRPWWARERPDRELVVTGIAFASGATAVILAVALAVWSLAPPSWQALIEDEQRTAASALTVISIWTNNLLVCSAPVLAGVFAHRLVGRGHPGCARFVIAVATLAVMRSLLIIGLVGGLDPGWLAGAAAWWILEIAALGTCSAAGWHAFRSADSTAVSRHLAHALTLASTLLGVAAVVEVALT